MSLINGKPIDVADKRKKILNFLLEIRCVGIFGRVSSSYLYFVSRIICAIAVSHRHIGVWSR
jgi:hypothetical protein